MIIKQIQINDQHICIMTFKEYFNLIAKQVFVITERCSDRLVAHHTVFGFNDDPDGSPGQNYFYLIGNGEHLPTYIDFLQGVEIKKDSIFVVDRNGTKIELTFHAKAIIPHPAQ